jgi:hypothetical protein
MMGRWIRTGSLSLVMLSLLLGVAACSSGGSSSTGSSSAASAASAKSVASADKPKPPADSASATASGGDVDIGKLVDASAAGEQTEGALNVDLGKVDDKAPLIGAKDAAPAPKAGGQPTWLDAGSFSIPNPGLKTKNAGGFTLMPMPDDKAGLVFRGVKDDAELKKVTTDFISSLKLKSAKFGKVQLVRLGPDQIPAAVGGGQVVGQDGKPGKLMFGVIHGTPNIFMAMGAGSDASPEDAKLALAILSHVKKK